MDAVTASTPLHTSSLYAPALTERTDKVTWFGSGKHIPEVMNDYPREEWCTCLPRTEWRDPDAVAVGTDGMEGKGKGKQVWEYPRPGERADGWFKR